MPRRLNDSVDVKTAVATSAGSIAPLVATPVNATGFSRARFIFSFGNGGATTAALSAGIGIWQATTSGGTFSSIASAVLAAVSSGLISETAVNMVIDVPTSSGTPWLKVSGGSMISSGIPHGCVVELYNGVNNAPTSSLQQLVTV